MKRLIGTIICLLMMQGTSFATMPYLGYSIPKDIALTFDRVNEAEGTWSGLYRGTITALIGTFTDVTVTFDGSENLKVDPESLKIAQLGQGVKRTVEVRVIQGEWPDDHACYVGLGERTHLFLGVTYKPDFAALRAYFSDRTTYPEDFQLDHVMASIKDLEAQGPMYDRCPCRELADEYCWPFIVDMSIQPSGDKQNPSGFPQAFVGRIKSKAGNLTNLDITFSSSPDLQIDISKVRIDRLNEGEEREFKLNVSLGTGKKPREYTGEVRMQARVLPDYAKLQSLLTDKVNYSFEGMRLKTLTSIQTAEKQKKTRTYFCTYDVPH